MSTAAIVGGTVAAAGISAGASISAANTQADAATQAANLQAEEAQNALNFQQQEFSTQQANEAPFLAAGTTAVNNLAQYKNFTNPVGTFVPPTPAQAVADPGYQFVLQQGEEALRANNAATGNVYSGTALRAANDYAQGAAATQYGNVYNRALQTYGTNYNTALQTYEANLNRLQSLAGEGLTSAGQIGTQGQAAATNVGNIDVTTGRNIAQELNNAAAAEASGYVGGANAIGGAVNSLSQYSLLNSFMNPSTGAGLYTDPGVNVLSPSYMPGGGGTGAYTGPITADPGMVAGIG